MKPRILFFLMLAANLNLYSQSLAPNAYRDYVMANYNFSKNYDAKKNLYLQDNIVHIFIDEEGNLIETGIPTTAIESYSYQLHLITNIQTLANENFEFSYRGEYKPVFNINSEISQGDDENQADATDEDKVTIVEFIYPKIGPFTSEVTIILKRKEGSSERVLFNQIINIAKTYHVSISTGLFMTTLRNPVNINESTNSNGETTLVADDANTRGLFALSAVFYPKGRSFLFPPSGGLFSSERFGVLVGTQINKDQFENFIGGIQFDFARGGSIAFGAHYGRRNTIAGNNDFDFGIDKFEGNINTDIVKDWNVGFFIGTVIDLKIFGQLFSTN